MGNYFLFMKTSQVIAFVVVAGISGCLKTQSTTELSTEQSATETIDPVPELTNDENEIISLSGALLPSREFPDAIKKQREDQLSQARTRYESEPENEEYILWYGRRLSYLGLYRQATHIFSIGLNLYPHSYHLFRHRGEQYIRMRMFNEAIEDLQQAAFYAVQAPNATEPDGIPNRLNRPLTNDKYNIWYYLGISYYLKGNYDKAISAFKKCLTFCNNDDLKVAATDWFYMTYRKIGNTGAANELLNGITRKMVIVENYSFHQHLLMYKGIYLPEMLIDKAHREDDSLDPNLGYGVGNFFLYSGNVPKAREIFDKIMHNPQWDALGFVASEADMMHLPR